MNTAKSLPQNTTFMNSRQFKDFPNYKKPSLKAQKYATRKCQGLQKDIYIPYHASNQKPDLHITSTASPSSSQDDFSPIVRVRMTY
jgi:hypothetical protein